MIGLSAFRKIALAGTVVAAAGLGVAASSTSAAAEWDHGGGHHRWHHHGWHGGGWGYRGWGGGWGYGGFYGRPSYYAGSDYSGENCATRSRWVLGRFGWHRVVWRGCRYDQ